MGNNQTKNETQQSIQSGSVKNPQNNLSSFTQIETTKIRKIFAEKTGGSNIQSPQILLGWISPNIAFCEGFYNWISVVSGSNGCDDNKWLDIAEIFVKDPSQYKSILALQYRDIKKIDLLVAIILNKKQINEDDLVTMEQLEQIFDAMFSIFSFSGREAAVLFANRIYDDTLRDSHRIGYVMQKFTSYYPFGQTLLTGCFLNIFLEGKGKVFLPKLSNPSEILNDQYILSLVMSDMKIQMAQEIQLLYSNVQSGKFIFLFIPSGTSFNRLAWNILGYGGATLLVIQLGKKQLLERFRDKEWPIIYGAYISSEWSDGLKFQGDSGCYLFSISPTFRLFTTYGSKGGSNYAYLSTKHIDKSKYKVGLGIGGIDDFSQFRIWIDDDIESCSQVHTEDQSFQTGYVAGEIDGKVNISRLEVWGLGGKAALEKQHNYRIEKQEELERMRKVDKKAFFNSFDQEFFFSKTFSHKSQVREDAYDESQNQCQKK